MSCPTGVRPAAVRRVVVGLLLTAVAFFGLQGPAGAAAAPSLTVSGPAIGAKGAPLTLTGRLTADAPGGITVQVSGKRRVDGPGGVTTILLTSTATTAADGTYNLTVTPAAAGYYTYTVSVEVPSYAAASTDVTVNGPDTYIWAPVVTQAYVGHPYTFTAGVYAAVGAPIADARVQVTKTVKGTTTRLLDVTSPAGTLTLTGSSNVPEVVSYWLSWSGDQTHSASSGGGAVRVWLVPSSITVTSTPAQPKALDAVTIAGAVTFGAGESVTAPLIVTVRKSGPSAGAPATPLPDVVTAADGTFSFTDALHAGAWGYDLSFAGDALHAKATQHLAVTIGRQGVTIALAVLATPVVVWTGTARIAGTVSIPGGHPPAAAGAVRLTARGPCTITTSLTADLAADGSFTATVIPPCPTQLLVDATYSDADHAGPVATSFPVAVGRIPAGMRLQLPAGNSVTADQVPEIGVLLPHAVGLGHLAIYAQPYGQSRRLVYTATFYDGGGSPSTNLAVDRRTTFTAVYSGDDGTLPATASAVLLVRPSLQQQVLLGRTSHGIVYLTHRQHADLFISLHPQRAKARMQVVVTRYLNGSWRVVFRTSVPAVDNTNVSLPMGPKGSRYRVRTTYLGDVNNAATSTNWQEYHYI